MGFELLKNSLPIVEKVCSVKKEYIEEFDIIVPDSLPDISKVVDAKSQIFLKEWVASHNKLKLSGEIESNVLYIPEGEQILRKINFRTPFTRDIDVKNSTTEGKFLCAVASDKSEAAVLNSRKLSVKTQWNVRADGYEKSELMISKDVASDGEEIETLKSTVSVTLQAASESVCFPVSYDVEIPYGQGVISDILKINATIVEKEIKPVTNKIIAKGIIIADFIYTTDGGGDAVSVLESEIPFSQIFDVENVNEDSAIDLAFDFSDIAVEASQDFDGEIRGIKFDGDVRANIRVFNTESSENIEDAYGVSCNITAKSDALLSENLVDDIKSQLNLKDTVDLSALYAPIKNVLSMEVKTKIKDEKVEDGKLMIEGTADFDILCVTEWETFDVVKVTHSIPISFAQAIEGKTKADKTNVSAIVSGSSYNMNMAGEMEVRCVVNINAKLLKQSDIMTVCEMKVSEKIASDKKIPSMTAYFVNDKDSLWDIGKKYSVSIASIKKTNKFEENKTPKCGEMILIPR